MHRTLRMHIMIFADVWNVYQMYINYYMSQDN